MKMTDKASPEKLDTEQPVEIRDWEPAFREAFFQLNKAWIEVDFPLEPLDIAVLSNPEDHILNKGGAIVAASSSKIPLHPLVRQISIFMRNGRSSLALSKYLSKAINQVSAPPIPKEEKTCKTRNSGFSSLVLLILLIISLNH